jgi:hypothetical protein
MKKILFRIGIVLVVLVVFACLAIHFFLDGAVKRGVETIGPKLTKVDIKLDAVHLSLLTGAGKIEGLQIGNPDGYKTPRAISVGTVALKVEPGSLLADKLIIKTIDLEAPDVTFEVGLHGNNLKQIMANMDDTTSGSGGTNIAGATPKEEKKASRKLEVDDFEITGAKLEASFTGLGGKTITLPLPTIHLTNLGTGPDGITPTQLTKEVISAIEAEAAKSVASSGGNLGNLTKGLGKNAGDGLNNAVKGLGGLFKKQ